MSISDFLPNFRSAPTLEADLVGKTEKKLSNVIKTFRPSALAVSGDKISFSSFLTRKTNFESSPVDFDRINKAVDTDSYAQQAFAKYRELIWKEGWELISKNDRATTYLWKRINLMEVAMKRSFYDFLTEAIDEFTKFNNVFIVKSRGDLSPFFPGKLTPINKKGVITGYYVLPTEQVEILRDKYNNPIKYRQKTGDGGSYSFSTGTTDDPTWDADDVIHLSRNKKPGRAFGTPFIAAALDDIVSLRQIEEDILNLIHRELFPLYFYKIGDDLHPADQEELDQAEYQLESLRVEGGLIAPHRHSVEVIGAENKALDISNELTHFKERVAIGLGVFPHHLGMSAGGGNRSVTDRLDVALYDKIKEYQKYISEEIRIKILNELLIEGGFDPFGLYSEEADDRCTFSFHEIDIDTQIKKETHIMSKTDHNVLSVEETRRKLGEDSKINDENTVEAMRARIGAKYAIKQAEASAEAAAKRAGDQPKQDSAQPNLRSTKKGSGNVMRPANQHGTRTSPNVRHSTRIDFQQELDTEWLNSIESLLEE